MEHHRTDGISLTTPASAPRDDQKVRLDLIKPLPPPSLLELTIPPPKQTPPRANESHRMGRAVAGRDDDDEVCRAHKRVDNPANTTEMSTDETAASTTASASTDATAPHRDHAKVTRAP